MIGLRKIIVLGFVLTANMAMSADSEGNFAADGVGARSCQNFLDAISANDEKLVAGYAGWMTGFISGYNVYAKGVFDVTPWQTAELLLLKMKVFCEANPDVAFLQGVGGLISTLADDAMVASSDLVSVRNQGKAVVLYRETLEVVRQALVDQGYSINDPSGDFGTDFAKAITGFQTSSGLPKTGLPDQPTLNKLLN